MDAESRRDLQLLEALEQEATITQRTLAGRLGIALGLTNLYLKRLIRKGHIKCVTVAPNRLMYMLTPRGVARKARLTYEFMRYSLDFYHDVRRYLRENLGAAVAAQQRVAVYGTGDAAELVYLLLKDMGLELVAVFDAQGDSRFLGMTVQSIAGQQDVAYDVLIIAVLERPAAIRKLLSAAGVPADKVLTLQAAIAPAPDAPPRPAAARPSVDS
jgi:DNA-binding MarR family transcriptional regulator